MKEVPKEKVLDFTFLSILTGFIVFGIIGYLITESFLSQYIGDYPVLIFAINGIVGEGLILVYAALETYSKKNKNKKGLQKGLVGVSTFFKVFAYLFERLAILLGFSIFLGAALAGIFRKSESSGILFLWSISFGIAVIIFVIKYFSSDDHKHI